MADLVEMGSPFGLREVRLHESYLFATQAILQGMDLPGDDAALSRTLWRMTKRGELAAIASGRGQGKRALYVRGQNWGKA